MVVGLVVLGRYDRAPGSALTGLLFFLPHAWLVHLVAVFGMWCVLPDRRTFPGVLACSGLLGMGVWGPGMAAWAEASDGPTVRVLSWNIQRLWGGPGNDLAPGCVVQAVLREDPDVVALMEASRDNLDALAAADFACAHTTYTTAIGSRRGGLAVCGRNGWEARGSGVRFVDQEDWFYLQSEVARGAQVLNVLAVHLLPHHFGASADATERVARRQANQSAALVERVVRLRDPTIVAGDFNSTRDFWLHASLRDHLVDTWERAGLGFGATKYVWDWLPLRIDFVYASPALQVVSTEVQPDPCSDHRAVTTTLVLPPDPDRTSP